ncbi:MULTISPECIES: GreA/GreB family elongation factor [unclassified Streptomyces]|uniref:GreA/GreB family elongation factor n=1 Tax=unclassified Streptomyces TaxID=2593676 RepID=UPI0006AEFF33|nr:MULTISPECIES: GreA/GreB family elongation factor [unclassified Streptomyces]KOX30445.1 nucleoside diphosphate kinase regulator [Streptomyces sp. NRRL F-6491]KOX46048.1 nucleoside diphosphate kinase regulator [Streptomyces sp. NRRL F-6492]
MTGGPEPINAVAREALEKELAQLRAERDTVAATLRDGGGDQTGDRADEADELMRADEADRLNGRIGEIEDRLEEASVAAPPPAGSVGVGSSVTVRFDDGTETTVRIAELPDALDPALVTGDSPLGKALLGHGAGDTVTYETPGGRTTATVVSVG